MANAVIDKLIRSLGLALLLAVAPPLCAPSFGQAVLSGDTYSQLRADIQAELDARYAAAQRSDETFPGATLAVGLPDGSVAEFSTGFADLGSKLPMSPALRMPSGSIGKTYVAALALKLAEDKLLNLDDRLATWLADLPWYDRLPNHDTITLRHLLNHSSGIIDHVFDTDSRFQDYVKELVRSANTGRRVDPRELVRFVFDQAPLFPAGQGFHYSDTNYLLLGLVIETATHSSYYEVLSERFLEPLHLEQTSPLDRRDIAGLAQGYAIESQELFGLPPEMLVDGVLVFDPAIEWTGGGLAATAADLARWAMALFAGDVLQAHSLAEMLNSIAMPKDDAAAADRRFGYGLGVNIVKTKHGVAYRHGGFFPGYNSMLAYYPEYGVAVAMQINTDKSQVDEHVEAIAGVVARALSKLESPHEAH